MTELLPIQGLYAIEVPEDAKNLTIKNGVYVKWLMIDGNPFMPINEPSKFRILFTTKNCTEEQANGIIGPEPPHYSMFPDFENENSQYATAMNSFGSLLRSHNLTANNYLLIKRTNQEKI